MYKIVKPVQVRFKLLLIFIFFNKMQKFLPPCRMLCTFILNNCLHINSPVWLMQYCLDFLFKKINIYYFQHLPQYQPPATKALKNPRPFWIKCPMAGIFLYSFHQSIAEGWALQTRRLERKRNYCFLLYKLAKLLLPQTPWAMLSSSSRSKARDLH